MQRWYCQMPDRLHPNCHSLQDLQMRILLEGFVLYLAVALGSPVALSRDEMRWHACCLRQWSQRWDLEIVLSPLAAQLKMKAITWAPSAGRQ